VTILEACEDKPSPADFLGHIVEQDHDRQGRQEGGEDQWPVLPQRAQWSEAVESRHADQ
jgi:hypothetical protein